MKQLNWDMNVKQRYQTGMTLLEITVVLLILIALAGLAMPYIGGTSRKAFCDATDISMANIKRAIMDRYYLDTLGHYPASKGTSDYSLHYLFNAGGWSAFDPDTAMGFRPDGYLQGSIILGGNTEMQASSLDASFRDVTTFDAATDHVHINFANDQSVILDAWGRPIVLQVHTNYGARLVSAGPGIGLGFTNGTLETTVSGLRDGDDRVLYLQQTPAGEQNTPCGDL